MRKIEIEKSDRIDGIKVITWDNPDQSSVTHMTWTEYDAIVAGAQKIRRRPAWKATPESLAELERERQAFCDECGHYHRDVLFSCPETPCGDYRCCIN